MITTIKNKPIKYCQSRSSANEQKAIVINRPLADACTYFSYAGRVGTDASVNLEFMKQVRILVLMKAVIFAVTGLEVINSTAQLLTAPTGSE